MSHRTRGSNKRMLAFVHRGVLRGLPMESKTAGRRSETWFSFLFPLSVSPISKRGKAKSQTLVLRIICCIRVCLSVCLSVCVCVCVRAYVCEQVVHSAFPGCTPLQRSFTLLFFLLPSLSIFSTLKTGFTPLCVLFFSFPGGTPDVHPQQSAFMALGLLQLNLWTYLTPLCVLLQVCVKRASRALT